MFCRSSGCIKIIILLLGNLYELTQATIEVSSVNRTWSEASRRCLLFGSNNTGDVQINKINIPSTLSDGLYWIGATVKSAWFEFLGNYSPDVGRVGVDGTSMNNFNDPIYDCYFKCRESENLFFALMKKKCYCFSSLPSDSQRSNLPKVYHYLVNNRNPSKIMGSLRGDCVAFSKPNGTEGFHEVLDCETRLPPLCQSEIGKSNSPWLSAVNNCSGVVQSSFSVQYLNVAVGGPWWTGITRRSIKEWDDGSKDTSLFGCLAVKIPASEIPLQEVLCDNKLPSLCIKGTVEGKSETKDSNDEMTMTIAISVTATCVFLVLLIFVGVAFWKIKHNKTNSKIARMPSVHNQNYEGEMEGAIIPHLYAEVERNNIYSGVSSSNQNNSADDTYDHCKIQSMGRTLVVPADLYDSVNNVTSDKDYDYLHTT
ncbi:uncharacterized protein LOC133184120 [Saccostrea echinata]|uniref:uncharacterized protein LOC133184120 n=1 Tax=Saccostrea echinata TaxID=191078 RepID=UPI002A7FA858|nr:uncharacterized protein LOC133184120 [Saccostrea echinata]